MMGLQHLMPLGHEFDRWNFPLDQLPKKELNRFDWGKPITWNPVTLTHQLFTEANADLDEFSWMTHDYEVEMRALEIPNAKEREFFCRNFGGHWNVERNRFFRFPKPRVAIQADGTRDEVEQDFVELEEYKKYDQTLVRRALVLTKLEEAICYRHTFIEESFKDYELDYWNQLEKIDDALDKKIFDWRRALRDKGGMSLRSCDNIDNIVHETVAKIERAMEIWEGKNGKCGKNKRKTIDVYEEDPQWGNDNPRQEEAMEEQLRARGSITRPSHKCVTRSSTLSIE